MIIDCNPIGIWGTDKINGTCINRVFGFTLLTNSTHDGEITFDISFIDLTLDVCRGILKAIKEHAE